jgi:hypothetical protein
MGNKGRAPKKRLKTLVRQQSKKEIDSGNTQVWRTHSPKPKVESSSSETQAPAWTDAVGPARDALKQRARASKTLAKTQAIAGRSKQVMKDIADYKAKRKQNLKDSQKRLKRFKAAAPKRRAAALARKISQQEQSEVLKDCLQMLEDAKR